MLSAQEKIIRDPFSFELLEEKTEELALLAVTINQKALVVIPEQYQTYDVCKKAIKNNMLTFKFIKNPTEKLYNYALLHVSLYSDDVFDKIDTFSININVIKRIVRLGPYSVLKKIPKDSWSDIVILELLKDLSIKTDSICKVVELLKKEGIEFSPKASRKIVKKCSLDNVLPPIDLDENLVKYYLKSLYPYNNNKIPLKFIASINMTDSEFYNYCNTKLVIPYIKNVTEPMILLCARDNPMFTIEFCIERNILTDSLLFRIIERSDCFKIDKCRPALQERIKNADLSIEQLEIIKKKNRNVYEFIFEHNTKLKQNMKDNDRLAYTLRYLLKTRSIRDVINSKDLTEEMSFINIGQLKQILNEPGISNEPLQFNDHNNMFRRGNPIDEDYEKAVTHNWMYLQYLPIKNRTLLVCAIAYKQNKEAEIWIPETIKNYLKKLEKEEREKEAREKEEREKEAREKEAREKE